MCIYPHGSRVFMIARVLILLFLAARLTAVSLDNYADIPLYYPLHCDKNHTTISFIICFCTKMELHFGI